MVARKLLRCTTKQSDCNYNESGKTIGTKQPIVNFSCTQNWICIYGVQFSESQIKSEL
jgi:hypothetical protein